MPAGIHTIWLRDLKLKADVKKWDEGEGNLYELTAELRDGDCKMVTFGVRDFGDDGKGHLALNGRRIFLRSEANCCEFPETGHPPMTVEEWDKILHLYQSYGVNCMRFSFSHSTGSSIYRSGPDGNADAAGTFSLESEECV